MNCLHSFKTKNKLDLHKTVCENRDFSNVIILSEDTRIFEFNQYQKSDKAPFIIYADLECITKKIDVCKNNAENSSTTKVCKHIPSSFLMSTISLFRSIENKHDVCGGENYMKFKYTKFCEFLREHTMKIINIRKKGIRSLTKEQQESYENAKICYICKEKFENKDLKDKKYCKVRDHCYYPRKYRGTADSECSLKYSVPKKFLYFFIADQTMIIILSKKSWQKNLKMTLLV